MDRLFTIALAAFVGALASALLGWLESNEPFDGRKFGASAIRGLLAAAIFAVGYEFKHELATTLDLFYAFLGGAGVDALGNRIAGKLSRGSWPVP